jgi:hypothetical protein
MSSIIQGPRCTLSPCTVLLPNCVLPPNTTTTPFTIYDGIPAQPIGSLSPTFQLIWQEHCKLYFRKFLQEPLNLLSNQASSSISPSVSTSSFLSN